MLRNSEIRLMIIAISTVSLAAIIASSVIISTASALFTFVTSVLLTGIFLVFTFWRYHEIEKLSGYLRKIRGGDYSLDVRDNSEGELSILKNNIYKVTVMLSEHHDLLQNDKLKMTNAISDISHQLKTPLTSMMVMADLLSQPHLPAQKRTEFTRNIQVQLERIEWLVSSLLKISKIDAGAVVFKKEPVQVKKMLQKSLESIVIPMDIKEQTVSLNGEDTVAFLGDFNWTAEALINILKNSVEHTQDGGSVTISFSENALFTEIFLSDNGKGIAKEDLPYIFQRFYRGKNASDDSVGIGLALAHSIITSQNGTIEVKSKPGEGTQFQIKFYKQVI